MNYDDMPTAEVSHVLGYGVSGVGKSTAAALLTKAGYNLKWVSTDGGHTVIRKLPPELRAMVDIIHLPDTRSHPIAQETVRKLLNRVPVKICNRCGKVACSVHTAASDPHTTWDIRSFDKSTILVLDHITQVSDSIQNYVTKDKPVDYKLQLDDYGACLFFGKELMSNIQNAPCHILALAHVLEDTNEVNEKKFLPSFGSSSLAPRVGSYFDHVIYFHVSNQKHKLGSGSTYMNNVVSRSRTDIYIENVKVHGDNPSLKPFFDGSIPKEENRNGGHITAAGLVSSVAVTGSMDQAKQQDSNAGRASSKPTSREILGQRNAEQLRENKQASIVTDTDIAAMEQKTEAAEKMPEVIQPSPVVHPAVVAAAQPVATQQQTIASLSQDAIRAKLAALRGGK